jgi:hypothetical protein
LDSRLLEPLPELVRIKLSSTFAQAILGSDHDHIGKLHLLHLLVQSQDRYSMGNFLLEQGRTTLLQLGERIIQNHGIGRCSAHLQQLPENCVYTAS